MKSNARYALIAVLACQIGVFLASGIAEAANFQQYLNGSCSGLICRINFTLVPVGERLEISNTSCYVRTANADFRALQLLVNAGSGVTASAVTLAPAEVGSFNVLTTQYHVYQSNDQIFAFAKAGQRFQAYAELATGSIEQFACHISGHMLP